MFATELQVFNRSPLQQKTSLRLDMFMTNIPLKPQPQIKAREPATHHLVMEQIIYCEKTKVVKTVYLRNGTSSQE